MDIGQGYCALSQYKGDQSLKDGCDKLTSEPCISYFSFNRDCNYPLA